MADEDLGKSGEAGETVKDLPVVPLVTAGNNVGATSSALPPVPWHLPPDVKAFLDAVRSAIITLQQQSK